MKPQNRKLKTLVLKFSDQLLLKSGSVCDIPAWHFQSRIAVRNDCGVEAKQCDKAVTYSCHAPVEQATLWCHADLESMGAGTHAITTGLINLATEIWQTVDKKHRCACCCGFTLKFDIRIGAALGTEHLQGCDCFGVCSRVAWPFVCGKKNVEGCRTSTDLNSPQPLAESSEVIQMCRMQVAQP